MVEEKTIIVFTDSNQSYKYKTRFEGLVLDDYLKIVGMVELLKKELLEEIDELSEETEE